MAKWVILLLTIITLMSVFADNGRIETYKPKKIFDLNFFLSNDTQQITSANCSIQIRNESYNVVLDANMNEIGGGWYNYTYNTSQVGKYFCRQNCTISSSYFANRCDFIIKGDKTMPIAIMIMLSLIVLVYIWFIHSLNEDIFSQHGLIKSAFFIFIFWFLLIPLNFGIASMAQEGASQSMINMISTVHIVMIYLNLFLTAYFIGYVIFSFIRSITQNATK